MGRKVALSQLHEAFRQVTPTLDGSRLNSGSAAGTRGGGLSRPGVRQLLRGAARSADVSRAKIGHVSTGRTFLERVPRAGPR